MSPKKKRKRRPAPARHVCRRTDPLSIVSTRVLDGTEPLRLVDEFPDDLAPLLDLPAGHLAERYGPGFSWRVEQYVEE
ncbi:hypothetical protein [Blastococcus capsensis]|uniref:hypothetical protein n=1 Tax=Blastococcus capsensis TaxID=1564163 RepID=UPI0025423508|nr:hypothetical protein [Blastococcus capsensis]MDK3258754.1 hypothetical protein [Blastococcus capsensis]